ncbi:MAG: outer membrane beta-barrel protein [Thermoguttaceae bacterium]
MDPLVIGAGPADAQPQPPAEGGSEAQPPPLWRESWLYRPWNFGGFLGVAQGSPLIQNWVGMNQGVFAGVRLGRDWNPCLGTETRFAWNSINLYDSGRELDAQIAAGAAGGYDQLNQYGTHRVATSFVWDLDVLFYPWGDQKWRPYFSVGAGTYSTHFSDLLGNGYHRIGFSVPLALGVKYRWTDAIAFRLEAGDNLECGGQGIDTVQLASLTGGIELRFGGTRTAYWPWNPSAHYW